MKRRYVVLIILSGILASDYSIYILTLQPTVLANEWGLLLGRNYLFAVEDIGIVLPITIVALAAMIFRHKIQWLR